MAKLLLIALVGLLLGCMGHGPVDKPSSMTPSREFVAGGVYSIDDGEGEFGVAKVLVVDGREVHVRVYKNRYPTRPATVDLKSLSLGSIGDPEGFGMGHLPLSQEGFAAWNPVLVSQDEVRKDELEGYEMWKDAGGEVF